MDINYLCRHYGFKPWLGTLPGWDWTYEHKDVVPPTQIEMDCGGVRHTMNIKNPAIMRDVVKSMRR